MVSAHMPSLDEIKDNDLVRPPMSTHISPGQIAVNPPLLPELRFHDLKDFHEQIRPFLLGNRSEKGQEEDMTLGECNDTGIVPYFGSIYSGPGS